MFTIYILVSKKRPRTYVGFTANLPTRILQHNSGTVTATKTLRPWKLIYTEFADTLDSAKNREQYWKSGAGRRNLKKLLSGSRPTFKKIGRGSLKPKKGLSGDS